MTIPTLNGHPAAELYAAQGVFLPGTLAADAISWPTSKRTLLLTGIPFIQAVEELLSTPGLSSFIHSWM